MLSYLDTLFCVQSIQILIKQSNFHNCGLISALISILDKNPKLLYSLISPDFSVTFHGSSTVPSAAYEKYLLYSCCPELIARIECAYFCLYPNISSNPATDLYRLTGWFTESLKMSELTEQKMAIFESLAKNGSAFGTASTCDLKGDSSRIVNSHKVCNETGIVENHCYAIVNIRSNPWRMQLKNPWGYQVPGNEAIAEGSDDGSFWLSFDEIKCHFKYLHIALTPSAFYLVTSVISHETSKELLLDEEGVYMAVLSDYSENQSVGIQVSLVSDSKRVLGKSPLTTCEVCCCSFEIEKVPSLCKFQTNTKGTWRLHIYRLNRLETLGINN
jgi:hypothetical protein